MTNTVRITLISFLTYFVLSAMLAPIGIISGPMAVHFEQPITEITRQFSWLTGGIFIGAVLALFVFDWFGLRKLFIVIYSAMALALFSLYVVETLTYSRVILGIVGVGSGIGLAGAALTISRTYDESRRASMLVLTDSCFSIAGFACAALASYLIAIKLGWSSTYQLIGLIAVVIIILGCFSKFPDVKAADFEENESDPWSASVWLCIASLFLYTLGQYSILFWLPNYAETRLGATATDAGVLIGQFWLGMFVAQLFVAWWVLKIGVRNLVLTAALATVACSIPLWLIADINTLSMLTLIWGFANLGMLKAILSLATQMVHLPSARLVSLLLLGATLGTAISPALTSTIVEWTDNKTILMFGSGCYGSLALLMVIAIKIARPPTVTIAAGD